MLEKDAKKNKGKVIRATDPIIDVYFGYITPPIGQALFIPDINLNLEVIEYLRNNIVRCLALGRTSGVRRGSTVIDTGQPLKIPPHSCGRACQDCQA